MDRVFDFWPAMHAKYGDFYELGIPGVGVGVKGLCYVIQDPHEMASILREEGQYPSGAAEFAWAFGKYMADRNMAVGGLVRNGPEWKRMRRFVQSDLLSPQAAQRYIPAILEAAQFASQGAPQFAADNNLNEYLNLASFDMFTNVMLGNLPKVSNPATATEEDRAFCHHVAAALRISSVMSSSVKEAVLNNMLNIPTKLYKEFESHWDVAQTIAAKRVQDLLDRRTAGGTSSLKPLEQDSYAHQAFTRQASAEHNSPDDTAMYVTQDEAKTVVGGLISAGVDTTGGMLSFKLLHLASSPEVQDKLYHELQPTLDANGQLTRESLAVPYLSAILRESHRLASANVMSPMKKLPHDRPVHGHMLPKGSVIVLDTYSVGMQQEHFEQDVTEFCPDRFSKDAVKARKGTRHAIVDHSFFSGPFSQGARKCPGSRVANLEAHALMSQWVLDYRMELPSSVQHVSEVPYDQETLTTAKLPAIQFTPRDGV